MKMINKFNFLIFVLSLMVFSCKTEKKENQQESKIEIKNEQKIIDLNHHLKSGMRDLKNNLGISDSLAIDVYLKSFGFYKNKENNYTLILELNDDITNDIVKKYTFGVELHVFEKDKEFLLPYSKSKNRLYDLRPFKPELKIINGHNYVTSDMSFKMKNLDKIVFYLYPRTGYDGKLSGKRIQLLDYSL